MTDEEKEVLIWFLARSGLVRSDIYDEEGFDEWYQEVRFCGLPWTWHERVYAQRDKGTADPLEAQIQTMGERAYKQILFLAQWWGDKFYYPGLDARGEHNRGPGQLESGP